MLVDGGCEVTERSWLRETIGNGKFLVRFCEILGAKCGWKWIRDFPQARGQATIKGGSFSAINDNKIRGETQTRVCQLCPAEWRMAHQLQQLIEVRGIRHTYLPVLR